MTFCEYQTLIITGADGFIGRHLLRQLSACATRPARIVALSRTGRPLKGGDVSVGCDVSNLADTRACLTQIEPNGIIHLVGVSAGNDLDAYFRTNVSACQNVLSVSAGLKRPPRIMVVGSSAQYGITTGGNEIVDENRPLLGASPYGVSKTLQEKWALVYASENSLPVICVRPFNVMGPEQPARLVPAAFLQQVRAVVRGISTEICVGNTGTFRDFTDVRDVAAAMWSLFLVGPRADGQVFNIASGQATCIEDLLSACISFSEREMAVVRKKDRIRLQEAPSIIGNAEKLRALTGWQPEISWQQSLSDSWLSMVPDV